MIEKKQAETSHNHSKAKFDGIFIPMVLSYGCGRWIYTEMSILRTKFLPHILKN